MDDPQPSGSRKRGARTRRGPRSTSRRTELDERLLLLAESERDVALARSAAEKVGVQLCACDDAAELARAIALGAGAAMIGDEMLGDGMAELRRVLDRQRKWSELPVIVLFREDAPPAALDALEEFELHSRVKLMLLHRPVPPISLTAALRSALKSRRRQYDVRDLLARLNKDVRLRDQFLAMLGHELRNPLSSIGYVSDLFSMSGDGLTAGQVRWGAAVIGRQLRHLSRLLDQLLDVARVQRGKIKLETAAVDLRAIVCDCVEMFDAPAKRRALSVHMPDDPVFVRGDSLRLTQVVENLLDNAYKYTNDAGRIRLSLKGGDSAVLSISDDGRGIGNTALEHLFEPFFKEEDRARAEAPSGLGLGLAMVDNLVRLHGGSVIARSEGLGRGAEFELRLPLTCVGAAHERAAADLPRGPAAPSRPLRLLIIEDDRDSADSFAMLLNSLRHEPHVVYDGTSGISMVSEREFDLVFVDLGLPDMDGEEVARRIRAELAAKSPALVALTGRVEPDDSGLFDDYLLKPVGRRRVERLLQSLAGGAGRVASGLGQ